MKKIELLILNCEECPYFQYGYNTERNIEEYFCSHSNMEFEEILVSQEKPDVWVDEWSLGIPDWCELEDDDSEIDFEDEPENILQEKLNA